MSRIAEILIDALGNKLTPFEQSDLLTGFTDLDRASRDPVIYNITKNLGTLQLGQQDGITVFSPTGARSIRLEPDGDAFFGTNIDVPSKTSLSVFSNAQYYNNEAMGKGDLLVGDNSDSSANLFWDASEGRLNFRGGTTTYVYIDTDGSLVASLGEIGGWNIGATTIYDDNNNIILDSANERIRVGGSAPYIDLDGNQGFIRSSSFAASVSGFNIDMDGNAEFNNITARGSLRSAVLEYGHILAVGGHALISKNAGELASDVYFDALYEYVDIKADDDGNCPVALNDIIYMRGWDATPGFEIFNESYYKVTTTPTDNGDGTWNLQLKCPITIDYNHWVAGQAFSNMGVTGDGAISLQAGAETRMVLLENDGTTFPSPTYRAVLGNINGYYGAGDYIGFGVGNAWTNNYLLYNGDGAGTFVLKMGDGDVTISDTGIEIEQGTGDTSKIVWKDTGVKLGSISAADSITQDDMLIEMGPRTGHNAGILIDANGGSGQYGVVQISAEAGGSTGPVVTLYRDGTTGYIAMWYQSVRINKGLVVGAGSSTETVNDGELRVAQDILMGSTGQQNEFWMEGSSGYYSWLQFNVGAGVRWRLSRDNDAETGSNAGSTLSIYRYSDAAGYLGRPLQIVRATGDVYFNDNDVRIAGGLHVGNTTTNPGPGDIIATNNITATNYFYSQGIHIYEGGTQVGELLATDTTWFRLNQNVAKNIYTPRAFYAAASLGTGLSTSPGTGSVGYTGDLRPYANSQFYTTWGMRTQGETTAGAWEGKTGAFGPSIVDLSATFGYPAGIKSVLARVITRSSTTHPEITNYMTCGTSTSDYGNNSTYSIGSNWFGSNTTWTDCDANGDIAVRINASGTQTSYLRLYGYAI